MKLKFDDVEVSLDVAPEPGLADSGDLESDLAELLCEIGRAAKVRGTGVVLFIDELQYVDEAQLAALISALHRVAQRQLPLTLVGAGFPQLLGQMGRAKSYAERLFEFVATGSLDDSAARDALVVPAQEQGVEFSPAALDKILEATKGYPYFLQEWGKHSWNIAQNSPILAEDVIAADAFALAELDASFFRVRFDRLTPLEKTYVRAMAELGTGPHRSGDIAAKLGQKVNTIAPRRSALITKGMIYSPSHGDTAFTVPLFDGFLRRIMPSAPPIPLPRF